MIWLGGDDSDARLFVGFAFSFVAGVLDGVVRLFGQSLFSTAGLVVLNGLVGAITGAFAGYVRAHQWKRRGWLWFLLDVSWGLTGATLAIFLHLMNGRRKSRPDVTHPYAGVVRYPHGWRPRGDFAITLGPVLSNCDGDPSTPLFKHEALHAFQNRLFGPIYMPTYLTWMLMFGAFGAAAGTFSKQLGKKAEALGYYSNPWEVWAYARHERAHNELNLARGFLSAQPAVVRLFQSPLAWTVYRVALVASVFFTVVAVLVVLAVLAAF